MGWAKRHMEEVEAQGFDCSVDKYVCKECIGNYVIKDYIGENADEFHCDYCGKESEDEALSVHLEGVLRIILNGIRTEWEDPNNCVGWNSREGGWLGVTVYDKREVIEEYWDDLDIENEDLIEDIIDSMNEQEWCERDPYGLRPYEYDFYTWELFCKQIKHETRYVFFKANKDYRDSDSYYKQPFEILETIGRFINELGLIKSDDLKYQFYRGRTHEKPEGYFNVKDLAAPPVEYAKYPNRMSPAGIPMFYGALDKKTAIEEIRDERKYISVGIFENASKLNLIDLCSLPSVPSVFDEENRYLRNIIFFLRSFIEDLSKPIEKDGREHIEYVPTQVVTEYFRHVFCSEEGNKIDGILYPSSKVKGGVCCVLFFGNDDSTQDMSESDKALSLNTKSIEMINLLAG